MPSSRATRPLLATFKAYAAAVPPTAVFPSEEAAAFAAHRRAQARDR